MLQKMKLQMQDQWRSAPRHTCAAGTGLARRTLV